MTISAGYVIIQRKPSLKFLLLKKEKFWDFPKGHLNPNESEIDAAKRELFEETKIKKFSEIPGFKEIVYFTNSSGLERRLTFFLAESYEQPNISDEHLDYKWASFKEALTLVKFKERKEILKKVKKFLA